jgi:hypothetical protein
MAEMHKKLFLAIKETLEKTDFMKGAVATTLRFGPPEEALKKLTLKFNKEEYTKWN